MISSTLAPSMTILKSFHGHTFQPYGILTTFPIGMGGNIISVEVVDDPLEYNLLLGHSLFYEMN